MKKIYYALFIVFYIVLGAALMWGYEAYVQKGDFQKMKTEQNEKIAMLNLELVMKNADVYKKAFALQQKYENSLKEKVEAERKALKEKEDKLMAEKDKMSKTVFAKKAQEFQKEVMDFQNTNSQKLQDLKEASQKASAEINKASIPVISKIAKEKGLDIILNQTSTVFYSNAVDITKEYIEALNEEKIEFSFENPFKK
ncbi:MAG: OmpH family outer membrane protein [Alphaproteobacteria bacterium]|nr:OmpH family outer membrane protein [Alphaproteobacteria bacterium]NCB49790.1 OmpH family outer membrane protein [Alphaproteobacteria bacterium]